MGVDRGELPYQLRAEPVPDAALFRTAGRGIALPNAGPGAEYRKDAAYGVTTEAEARTAVQRARREEGGHRQDLGGRSRRHREETAAADVSGDHRRSAHAQAARRRAHLRPGRCQGAAALRASMASRTACATSMWTTSSSALIKTATGGLRHSEPARTRQLGRPLVAERHGSRAGDPADARRAGETDAGSREAGARVVRRAGPQPREAQRRRRAHRVRDRRRHLRRLDGAHRAGGYGGGGHDAGRSASLRRRARPPRSSGSTSSGRLRPARAPISSSSMPIRWTTSPTRGESPMYIFGGSASTARR